MLRTLLAMLLTVTISSVLVAEDWRGWRGPTMDNHTPESANKAIPLTWSESSNVLWRSPVPGRCHASPIVVHKSIFVLTHEPATKTISLLRYNLDDGKQLGRVILHEGVETPEYMHKKNTSAPGTPSSDGNAVFVAVQVNDSVQASAVSLDGKILWQETVAPYRKSSNFWFGYGASPLLLKDSLVVAVDMDNDQSGLYALAKDSGKQAWKTPRPKAASYSSPILATVDGRPQILISGGSEVSAYDPTNGKPLWTVPATSDVTCGTIVWKDSMVFASGGFPDAGTFGIKVSHNSAEVVWQNMVKCYEQSMLVVGDYVYGIANNGIGYCWRASDGEQMWRKRINGPHSASPLLVGDRIYASNERGETLVFRATPDGFKELANNRLGDNSFASPIYADGKLLLRHASTDSGERKEFLYAVSKTADKTPK
ncbi:outer membrane protein assembly factor BamB family protein [Novipirellula artificiosorum]|uniref:Outer membrane biogenesis protein BamB n=1 Tax=Novipirellula artificiosorum TaxID=2528016 RepID=A0A5C6D6T3_9BACT|nr:PQQ-binding-like beta-propeller repeat protein [Novipirellula artificiosorum]TWU32632.1 outer membrane biogenesis protein BamB [Novipirellula artificiosorum]